MELFFHHVGQNGSASDFPKTIYNTRLISEVENSISDENLEKFHLLNELKSNFPSGRFNCWGVPEGANTIIQNLKDGDVVLLVESARIDGRVPIFCKVKVFLPTKFHDLSKAFWGDNNYPFIFFFDSVEIDLMWVEFRDHLGYSDMFNPHGMFYKVPPERLDGSIQNYINDLLKKYSPFKKADIYEDICNPQNVVSEKDIVYAENVNKEIDSIFSHQINPPTLTSGGPTEKKSVLLNPRDEAFRRIIKKIYNNSCAVCGSSLFSPDGQPEVQSAHIYPKYLNGNDDIRNGICLCRYHHWAFDCGWFSITDFYKITVKKTLPNKPEYDAISKYDGLKIRLPIKSAYVPHKIYLKEHRKLFGFE